MSVLDRIAYIEVSSAYPTVRINSEEIEEIGYDRVRFYLTRDLRLHDYFLETSSPGVGEEISFVSGKVKFVHRGFGDTEIDSADVNVQNLKIRSSRKS